MSDDEYRDSYYEYRDDGDPADGWKDVDAETQEYTSDPLVGIIDSVAFIKSYAGSPLSELTKFDDDIVYNQRQPHLRTPQRWRLLGNTITITELAKKGLAEELSPQERRSIHVALVKEIVKTPWRLSDATGRSVSEIYDPKTNLEGTRLLLEVARLGQSLDILAKCSNINVKAFSDSYSKQRQTEHLEAMNNKGYGMLNAGLISATAFFPMALTTSEHVSGALFYASFLMAVGGLSMILSVSNAEVYTRISSDNWKELARKLEDRELCLMVGRK